MRQLQDGVADIGGQGIETGQRHGKRPALLLCQSQVGDARFRADAFDLYGVQHQLGGRYAGIFLVLVVGRQDDVDLLHTRADGRDLDFAGNLPASARVQLEGVDHPCLHRPPDGLHFQVEGGAGRRQVPVGKGSDEVVPVLAVDLALTHVSVRTIFQPQIRRGAHQDFPCWRTVSRTKNGPTGAGAADRPWRT